MATYTENYNLTIPGESDYYNVETFNENFETIDTLMAANEAVCAEVNEKIGSAEEGETIFSLLKSGSNSVIKSIQRVTYTTEISTSSGSVSIQEVDSTKCIVISERLYNYYDYHTKFDYNLTNTEITITHDSSTSAGRLILGFWIIEFN